MKQDTRKYPNQDNDIRPKYDFSGGVRGKHYKAYRKGHTVAIHREDGTTIVQQYKFEEGTVVLEPDVREYFPDSESVNNALRSLIALFPQAQTASPQIR